MQSKLAYLLVVFILLIAAQARSQAYNTNFTLQIGSFPDSASAENFITKLQHSGEQPAWGTVELPGRGNWTRVFIGSFQTVEAARRYGDRLIKRGIISEFLVKTSRETEVVSRPRKTGSTGESSHNNQPVASPNLSEVGAQQVVIESKNSSNQMPANNLIAQYMNTANASKTAQKRDMIMNGFIPSAALVSLPLIEKSSHNLAAPLSKGLIPCSDPVRLAIRMIVGETRSGLNARKHSGGLWLTGDMAEGLARIRWIAGESDSALVGTDENGKVKLDLERLAEAAGINGPGSVEDPLKVLNYIYSNEGLLLLVQLTQGPYRYCLHLGRQSSTLGEAVEVNGSINLDNNYDSRINTYRRNGKKLDNERPPEGFDSMVAINPIALWFNLREQSLVPVGHITFHELAEAHAKLVLELDYLGQASHPGAHNVALERERRLKEQRPFSIVIITVGSNRVLRSEEEIRHFYSQSGINVSSPR